MFSKNHIFKHFSKLKGKRLRRSLFLNKVAGLTLQLYKKRNPKVFFCEFCKIVGNFFLQNTFGGCFCYCLHRQTIWGPTNVFVTKNILWNHRKNRGLCTVTLKIQLKNKLLPKSEHSSLIKPNQVFFHENVFASVSFFQNESLCRDLLFQTDAFHYKLYHIFLDNIEFNVLKIQKPSAGVIR